MVNDLFGSGFGGAAARLGRRVTTLGVAWLVGVSLAHADAGAGPAAHLQARYATLQTQLNASPFNRPLYLVSTESPRSLVG